MNDSKSYVWLIVVMLGIFLFQSRETVREYEILNERNLSRMQYVESNLLSAKGKLGNNAINYSNNFNGNVEKDIDNALIDVRAEMDDLHKKIDKK